MGLHSVRWGVENLKLIKNPVGAVGMNKKTFIYLCP
jgi:hypothetical protein